MSREEEEEERGGGGEESEKGKQRKLGNSKQVTEKKKDYELPQNE